MSMIDRLIESIKNFFLDILNINKSNTSFNANQYNNNKYVSKKTLYCQKILTIITY